MSNTVLLYFDNLSLKLTYKRLHNQKHHIIFWQYGLFDFYISIHVYINSQDTFQSMGKQGNTMKIIFQIFVFV